MYLLDHQIFVQALVAAPMQTLQSQAPTLVFSDFHMVSLSPSQSHTLFLVQAIDAGRGAGQDWAEFKHRHRQAAVDSDLLYSTLQQAEQYHEVGNVDTLARTATVCPAM